MPNPRLQAKEALPWIGIGLGLVVILPWLRRLAPTPIPPGAEESECSGPYTLSKAQALSIADSIHAAVYGTTEDESEVTRLLMLANTDGDICRLITSYGTRRLQFGLGPYNLPQVVTQYLSESAGWGQGSYIDVINADYAAKGIRYRF